MLVKNEKFQDIDLSSLVKEILTEDEQERLTVSKDQAEDALAQMYYQGNLIANQTVFKNQNYMMPEAKAMVATEGVKKWLLEKVKEPFCAKFESDQDREEMANKIAEIIADLIPLKVIFKWLLKYVLLYFLNNSYSVVCEK